MIRSILFLLALIVAAFGQTVPSITNVTNAAIPELDLPPATVSLAPRSIATIWGTNLADTTASSVSHWSNTLGGTEVHLAADTCFDSSCDLIASLLYLSPTQINFLVPDDGSTSYQQFSTTPCTATGTSSKWIIACNYRIVLVRDGQRIDNQNYITGGPGRLIITSAGGDVDYMIGARGNSVISDDDAVFQVGYDCLFSYSLTNPVSCGLSWSQGQYRAPLGAITDAISGQLISSQAPVHQGQFITLWMTGLYSGVTLNNKTALFTANTPTPIGWGVAQLGQDEMNTLLCPSLQCGNGFGFVGSFMTPLPLWAGESPQFVGLDQINVAFPTCTNAPIATTEKRYDAFITYNTFDTIGIPVSAVRIYLPFIVRPNDPDCQWAINTTTKLTSSANPSVSGQAVTFTATVSPSAATGTITFVDGTNELGNALLSNGVATFSSADLSTGTHSITAVYTGSGGYGSSWSSAVVQTITSGSVSLSIIYSPSTIMAGQTVSFSVDLSNASATGTITLLDGTATIGTSVVSNGQAVFSTVLSVGNHTITASYSGDRTFSSTFTSVTVNAIATLVPTTITVTSNAKPSVYSGNNGWANVTITASITPYFQGSNGSMVNFFSTNAAANGGPYCHINEGFPGCQILFCQVNPLYVVEGKASCVVTGGLFPGTSVVTAVYSGDNTYSTSTSAPITQIVNMPLAPSPNPSALGQAVTFYATTGWPFDTGGIMTFYDGTTEIGVSVVSQYVGGIGDSGLYYGEAIFQTTALSVGIHSISATYTPTPGMVVATSEVVTQTVTAN